MGEVYRADDLKLGQPVALKFLPATLERDPMRLAQFHNEVRLARQIAHKNVCRMYDIGDADGLPFLTMEYVDGEDLSTLLRRIGRLPEDKALDIARQLCAGLAAAHERGVLHRDLKPANVMIDGNGQVRITDFGLAAIAGQVDQVRVGTPAYMAPEQLERQGRLDPERPVRAGPRSVRGLHGTTRVHRAERRRARPATSGRRSSRRRRPSSAISTPASSARFFAASSRDPAGRPRSALAVAASLPGGDPLAAALAAGETPSPEMVAAAGERKAASSRAVLLATATSSGLLAVGVVLIARHQLSNRVPFDKSPAVLVDRAQQALAALGYADAAGRHSLGVLRRGRLPAVRPRACRVRSVRGPVCHATQRAALLLPHQSSPPGAVQRRRGRIAFGSAAGHHRHDRGRRSTRLGRLEWFHAIPPQRRSADDAGTARPIGASCFVSRDSTQARFTPAAPEWLPRGEADTRVRLDRHVGGTARDADAPRGRVVAGSHHLLPDGVAVDARDTDAGSAGQSGHAGDERASTSRSSSCCCSPRWSCRARTSRPGAAITRRAATGRRSRPSAS